MKFKLDKHLTLEVRTALQKDLITVARKYFEKDPDSKLSMGICANLEVLEKKHDAYEAMYLLLKELNEPATLPGYRTLGFKNWEPRAYMALFLAEYLKDTIKELKNADQNQ